MEFLGTGSRGFSGGGIFGETIGGLNVDIFGNFRRDQSVKHGYILEISEETMMGLNVFLGILEEPIM